MKACFFCLFVSFAFAGAKPSSLKDIEHSLVVLSPGGSGTHVTLLNLHVLTRRPICLVKPRGRIAPYRFLGLPANADKSPLYQTHMPPHLQHISHETNQLILVLRNYKEWIVREFISHNQKAGNKIDLPLSADQAAEILNNLHKMGMYYRYLDAFEKWPKSQRLLLHYEDLVDHPEQTLTQLRNFLKIDAVNAQAQVNELKALKVKSLDYYHKRFSGHGGSLSQGQKSNSFHTSNLPSSILKNTDTVMRALRPKLYDRYLLRYTTGS